MKNMVTEKIKHKLAELNMKPIETCKTNERSIVNAVITIYNFFSENWKVLVYLKEMKNFLTHV